MAVAPAVAARAEAALPEIVAGLGAIAELGVPVPALGVVVDDALTARELQVDLRGAPLGWAPVPDDASAAALAAAVRAALAPAAFELLGIDVVDAQLAAVAATQPVLVRVVVPRRMTVAALAELVRALVREGVPVRDLAAVLEAVATAPAGAGDDRERLLEHVRTSLRRHISGRWAPRGQLEVFTVDAMIEDAVRDAVDRRAGVAVLALAPDLARDIVGAVRRGVGAGRAVVLASGDVRSHLRALLEGELPDVAVLAAHELSPGVVVRTAGRIEA
ncbi:MAG: FHIPEP family type III secretion protein [Kofleriaceae bacterium]